MSNTIASNNPDNGILVQPTGSAVVSGVLSNVTINNNFTGIDVDGTLTTGASRYVTIVDSEASNNGGAGVFAFSSGGSPQVTEILVGHSVVTGNQTGVAGSNILSFGDKDIDVNAFDNVGVLIPLAKH